MRLFSIYSVFLLLIFSASSSFGQVERPVFGPEQPQEVLVGYVVLTGDTLPHWYMQEVAVIENYLNKDKSNKMAQLRHNVYKVYPYAVEAARILNEVEIELKKAEKRKQKKQYIKQVEAQLNAKFREPLKNLSTTQGTILVKLINRQSGRDVYSVIKELKGGFTARVSQTAFYFFDNNLKAQYDPFNKDKDIEMIVKEIEAKAYYNHQIQNTKLIRMSEKK
jgi:hypothetical protein